MKKKAAAFLIGCILTAALAGCGAGKDSAGGQADGTGGTGNGQEADNADGQEADSAPVQRAVVGEYEAEDGSFTGNVRAGSSVEGYSGSGYAEGFEEDGDVCTITVHIETDGFYDLAFTHAQLGGYKENKVTLDGSDIGFFASETTAFATTELERIYMEAGDHEIGVVKYWGYIALDKMTVYESPELGADFYQVSAKLVNENADDCAKRLMSYLCDNYGTNVLTGQYCDTGLYGKETACIWKETGKFPAVVGLDMIEYSPSRVANGSSSNAVEYAKQAWEEGAIVTMCWHWNAPVDYLTGTWYSGFYKEHTNIDLDAIMNGEDEAGMEALLSDMDVIASELKELQEAGVPILWRPLHEASGGWFWWGDCEAQSCIALYRLMYDKFTNEYGLNNLIWVWNGQDAEWYPGDDVVDIVGIDIYAGEHQYSSQIATFLEVNRYAGGKKMVVLSENGTIPDPDLMIRDGAMWGFFATWGGDFVAGSGAVNNYSETYTEADVLKRVYEHEHMITLDELPDLTTYPIREDA
ncbi:MAG: beta-mannosidase [Clostridium sp.]|nr:beta-mannosidase [Clostridium sp.]